MNKVLVLGAKYVIPEKRSPFPDVEYNPPMVILEEVKDNWVKYRFVHTKICDGEKTLYYAQTLKSFRKQFRLVR